MKYVTIHTEALNALAKDYASRDIKTPDYRIPGILPEESRAFLSYVAYTTPVDFSFIDTEPPHHEFRVENYTGSKAMGRCFYRRFGETVITSNAIVEIAGTQENFKTFFRGEPPMLYPTQLEERRQNLLESAAVMKEKFSGNPEQILKAAGYNAAKLTALLVTSFPKTFGQDYYQNIRFDKRSRLFAITYHGRALHSNNQLKPLTNIESIGPIIDYRIPNALRESGVLVYSPELATKIQNQTALLRHGEEELAIRIASTEAVKELLKKMNEYAAEHNKKPFTIVDIDELLYQQGRKAKLPPHLCKTTDY